MFFVRTTLVAVLVAVSPSALAGNPAEPVANKVRRLHGIIDRDETWFGHILITDDLLIDEAVVTIQPGTQIQFVQAARGRHPALTVGSASSRRAGLVAKGTAAAPVSIRTRPGTNTGRLIIRVPDESGRVTSGPSPPTPVKLAHVRFESLGYPPSGDKKDGGPTPCVEVRFGRSRSRVVIEHCTFERTTRLAVHVEERGACQIEGSCFRDTKDRVAIEVEGPTDDPAAAVVALIGNRAPAAIRLRAATGSCQGNILIGPQASIVVDGPPESPMLVASNYVRNTSTEDDGGYCLTCGNARAEVRDNVLRGGLVCVLNGSRTMLQNAIIGEPRLRGRQGRVAHTARLLHALPSGARFEDNLLIGPAYSMLLPQPTLTPQLRTGDSPATLIRQNVFDGLGDSNRAIHLNVPGRAPGTVAIFNNVFLRVPTLVFDEARTNLTVTILDYNAAAPAWPRAYEGIDIGRDRDGRQRRAAHDLEFDEVAELKLRNVPAGAIEDFDDDLEAGRTTVDEVHRRLFDAYRPKPDSPLIGAGREDILPDGRPIRPAIGLRPE